MDRLVVLGAGPSSAVPKLRCLGTQIECGVCTDAYTNPQSRNRRLNVSVLIQLNYLSERPTNILVDCGKTFREGALRLFPSLGVTTIDAIILTHGHADAFFGLDDIREYSSSTAAVQAFLMESTFEEVKKTFGYLCGASDGRWVSSIQWNVVPLDKPFDVLGLRVTPLPVEHGPGYTCLGMAFGRAPQVLYLSDVSDIPAPTRERIPQGVDYLFLDCLGRTPYMAHYCFEQAVAELRALRAKRAYLVGLGHDMDYETVSQELREQLENDGLQAEPAYDGMVLVGLNLT
eukprot:TRINITY_DN8489_c0_g1_i1.p1 TRINITY_DN8489_c0_g1~~TRINITY_DN8489_c0_g1_i1.p1  ORF type:complete len:301 (-),score=35.40 TRINITY_DN8489_c0_g1_i1:15-878(-)